MRHRKIASKLGRSSSHRRAMFRNLVTSLLEHERIETTDGKAKQVRRLAERMITLGKRGTLHARRRALRVVRSKDVTAKLFADLADRYRERPGGYTRVVKSRLRAGDAAPLSIVELVEAGTAAPAPSPKPEGRRGRRKAAEAKPEVKPEKKAPRKRRAKAEAAEAGGEAKGGRRGILGRRRGKASEETTVDQKAAEKKKTARTGRKTSGRKTSGRKSPS